MTQPALTPRSGRRHLAALLLTLLVLLGGAAAFVAHYDPYELFWRPGRQSLPHRLTKNYPLLTMMDLRRVPKETMAATQVVILGDSRARAMTEGRTGAAAGQTLLNLGALGSTLEEGFSLLQRYEDQLTGLQTLVLVTPLQRFGEGERANRTIEAAPLAASAPRYLLNWQMLLEAEEVRQQANALAKLRQARRSAGSQPASQAPPDQPMSRERLMREYGGEIYRKYNHALARTRLQRLRQNLAQGRHQGLRVIFWCPPLQPPLQALVSEYKLDEEWTKVRAELQQIGEVADMTEQETINGKPFNFVDPIHIRDGQAVLEQILQKK